MPIVSACICIISIELTVVLYLALVSLSEVLKINQKLVSPHAEVILDCLKCEDSLIRLKTLDILTGMATHKNIKKIVGNMMQFVQEAEDEAYRTALVEKIVQVCSQKQYQYTTDFEWYIGVLLELCPVHATLIASQIMEVVIRVPSIRPFGVQELV
jgi:hypothetical protein